MADRPECTTCRAPLEPEQDWCLACGTARPGRLGQRPGWRAAVSVVGATLALAGGATAAAYAALSSDAAREAGAPAAARPDAAPVVAQAPSVPAPPPETTPPPVAPPDATPDPAPVTPLEPVSPPPDPDPDPPAPDPDPAPSTEGGSGSGGTGSGSGSGGEDDEPDTTNTPDTPDTPERPTSVRVRLTADDVTTFDPDARLPADDEPPAAEDAVDGDAETVWRVPADADGVVGVGLLVSLDRARTLRELGFDTLTPGFDVEVYATDAAQAPTDVLDPAWEQQASASDVGLSEELELGGRYRHVLLWIPQQSADTEVAIKEIRLRARP